MGPPGDPKTVSSTDRVVLATTAGNAVSLSSTAGTMVNKGTYSSGTTYAAGDVVISSSVAYVCKAATTGNAPPNATYWTPLAAPGTASQLTAGDGTAVTVGSGLSLSGGTITATGSAWPRVRAYGTVRTAVPNATWTIIDFDSNSFDTDTIHSTGNGQASAVTSAGTSPPTVTVSITGAVTSNSGSPNYTVTSNTGPYIVSITTGGARGTAVFKWSKDGGTTYATGVTTAATVALGTTGVTVAFDTGTYSTDNVYKFNVAGRDALMIHTAGVYDVTAGASFYLAGTASTGAGQRIISMMYVSVGGTIEGFSSTSSPPMLSTDQQHYMWTHALYSMAVGDMVYLRAYQSQGVDMVCYAAAGSAMPRLQAFYIGA